MAGSEAGPNATLVQCLQEAGAVGSGATGRLFAAIRAKRPAGVRAAIRDGADANHVAPGGYTPLMMTDDTTLDIVEELLRAGADPNKCGIRMAPLSGAARSGDLLLVKRLLAAGADLHALEPGSEESGTSTNAYLAAEYNRQFAVVDYLRSLGAGRPIVTSFEPLKPGVASWNDFSELLVQADAPTTATAIARLIEGTSTEGVYGRFFTPGSRAYVVARPRGMRWSNVLQIAPPRLRFEESSQIEVFARDLAQAAQAEVIQIEYSDTSDAAALNRFSPGGTIRRDQGWDHASLAEVVDGLGNAALTSVKKQLARSKEDDPTSSERLVALAESELFVAAALSLPNEPGRPVEVSFVGYPAEAFDGVVLVTN